MKTSHSLSQKRIVMAVTTDYLSDPRVLRSSKALVDSGYAVEVVARMKRGGSFESSAGSDEAGNRVSVAWINPLAQRGFCFYAEFNMRLFLRLMRMKADAFYANDTDTLVACYCAAILRRKALVFDAHELFPEVPELVDRPRVKHFWEHLEAHILPRMPKMKSGAAAMTVCQSIADHYRKLYGLEMAVVRNLPDDDKAFSSVLDFDVSINSNILLYQGAVNKGRGVRQMMEAMQFLPDYRLVVAGDGDEFAMLTGYRSTLPWRDRIEFLGHQMPDELVSMTSRAALGLVLLEPLGLSYYYSLPNRVALFAYAGVPVLASNFPEMARVVDTYQIGRLVDCSQGLPASEQLAGEVRKALADWRGLDDATRTARVVRVREELNWTHERSVLLAAVQSAFVV